mgnify:FL=1
MPTKKSKNLFSICLAIFSLFIGSCSEDKASDFEKLGATASSSGTIQGSVVSYSGNTALSGVSISFTKSGATAATISTDSSGNFSQSALPLGTYTLTYSKDDYLSATQSAILETDNQTLVTSAIKMLADTCSSGNIVGTISDATISSSTISGATINARSGSSVRSGTIVATTTTNSSGVYTLSSMSAGWYTIQVVKDNYIDRYFNVLACSDKTGQNVAMSPSLASGAMRVVLSWPNGSTAGDLDSHLTGPDNVTSRFHVYYPSSTYGNFYYYTNSYACSGCTSSQASDNVTVDRDDQSAAGTETITISSVRSGTYRYSVYDFDNGQGKASGATSTKLATSGADVTVYYNNGTTTVDNTYNLPNSAGTLWKVFTFTTSGGFVEIGTIDHTTESGSIE